MYVSCICLWALLPDFKQNDDDDDEYLIVMVIVIVIVIGPVSIASPEMDMVWVRPWGAS